MSSSKYIIGYDLNKSGQDYTALIEGIKKLGGNDWWHCLDSTWIIPHAGPATAIRDNLMQYIDANDELLVTKLESGEWATYGFNGACAKWLQNLN